MAEATTAGAPAAEQQHVLQTFYAPFAATGESPRCQYVDKALDAIGVDLAAALTQMPPGLLVPDPRWPGHFLQPADELALTVRGLAAVGTDAAADVDLFLRFLRLVVERERAFQPTSPTATDELAITSADVQRELGVGELEIRKLWTLIRVEPLLGSGGGDPHQWRYEITSDIRRYRDVRSVADYLARRPGPTRMPLEAAAANSARAGRARRGLRMLDAALRHPLIVAVLGGMIVAALAVWLGLK
jgi:hypothetical protein